MSRPDELARKFVGESLAAFVRRFAGAVRGPDLTSQARRDCTPADDLELAELARAFDDEAARLGFRARAWRGYR